MAAYCGVAFVEIKRVLPFGGGEGGSAPFTGCHSVMESPDSVRRVMAPISAMIKIIAQQKPSQQRSGTVG